MADFSHRKAKATITFTGADGKPAANTTIKIKQMNHEFLFGCGGFEFIPFVQSLNSDGNATIVSGDGAPAAGSSVSTGAPAGSEEMKEYLKKRTDLWLDLFNYATLPFYWGSYEPEEGGRTHEVETLAAAKFLKSRGVEVKGHPLTWHTACAQWLLKYDNKTILEKQLARIERELTAFKGVINMWDVINEVVIMPIYKKYDNPITRLGKEMGRIKVCKYVFDKAYELNPNGTFLINDFNLSTNYEILIDGLLNAGVPVNCIGLQSHQHHGIWTRDKLEEILARYEHFGLPIHFTENTIVAGPLVDRSIEDLQDVHFEDDAATPEFEQMQADAMERMYRAVFEDHPLVKAITNWDFGDGAWLNAPSGVIRRDCTKKPSYERLYKLIKEEWHTELAVKTDAEGRAVVEGFKGEYEAVLNGVSGKFTLADGNDSQKVAFA